MGVNVEGFPTLFTLKGLLPSVDSLVDNVVGAAAEGFLTFWTLEGLLPGVDSLMPR